MRSGLWNTLEALETPAAVLAEWRLLAGPDFPAVGPHLRPTNRLARDYPCLGQPRCGCRHEVEALDDERFLAVCGCGYGDCPPARLAPSDLVVHEMDALRFGGAVARALGFDTGDSRGVLHAAPKVWPAGTHAATQTPVYLALCPSEAQLLENLEGLAATQREPFILLAPTGNHRSEAVESFLQRQRCAFIPLARCLVPAARGGLSVTSPIQPILDRFALGLAEGKGLARTVEKIGRDIEAVAKGTYELRKENEELRRLQADGFFKFSLRVEGADFHAFAVIMALGTRKAAADYLKVPHRSFYDRVDKWPARGPDYQRMFRLIEWRKGSGRKMKLRLEDSLQSGEPGEAAENPETIEAVLTQIKEADSRSYPDILREILEAMMNQHPGNWQAVRDEVVGIITEEIPQ